MYTTSELKRPQLILVYVTDWNKKKPKTVSLPFRQKNWLNQSGNKTLQGPVVGVPQLVGEVMCSILSELLNQIKKQLCYDQFGEGIKYIHTQPNNSLIKKSSIYFWLDMNCGSKTAYKQIFGISWALKSIL